MGTISIALAWILSGPILRGSDPGRSPEGIPRGDEDRIRAAAPERPRVAPAKRRRVLIWSTPPHLVEADPHKGYCVPYGLCAMRILGEKTGAFEPVIGESLELFLPEEIRNFDAIVMNNSCGAWIAPGDADMERLKARGGTKEAVEEILRESLLGYVAGGGGIVAYHFAIGANRHWPAFQELLGASFAGHPWNEEVAVLVEEPGHPLLAAFGGKDFRIADEIYEFGPPYDRSKLRVLLSLDTERTNMGVKWIGRRDDDFALAWVKRHGEGRVFYAGFGHRTEIWWNPTILRFFLDGIQFAAGDLEAPTEPRPSALVRRAPGPTSPEIRAAKLRAAGVAEPSEAEIRRIEEAAPEVAPVRPAKRRRLLVWGHAWTHAPNPYAERAIEILGRKTGAFEATISDDPRLLLGDRLPRFDVLVLNNIHEPEPFLPPDFASLDPERRAAARAFDEAVKESAIQFVRGGKGVVGIHAAAAACEGWTAYGAMLGGLYGGHIHGDVAIRLEDPAHPILACFEGKPFSIRDEIYIFREPYSRANLRVLASLDLDRMADPGKRPDRDYPVSWVRAEGKGRVFYTTLGHEPATYSHPLFLRHLLAGIQFAAGDLEGETAPNPK